ncbi:MAG TPA: hypothetical protein ENF87_02315 [Thermoproteales archaeon]|nr:hypothetical protein [Thermoproteales archaeon]
MKFRTEGREYTLNKDEVLMGFALEAISIFFLSSTKVKDYTLKEVSELVEKTEKKIDKEFTEKYFEKVLESCREVEELASYCRENRDVIPLTFLDDYYLTFTSKEPPDWVKERYIGFPNVEEYIKQILEYTKTGYYAELISEDELTSIGNLGKSYTRYLKSLARGLVEAHKLLKEAGDPVGFRKKVKEYRKCIQGGLIGKAIELKKDIIVPVWENPLKWEETLNEYKRTFEREMFLALVEVNRKVLGTAARILYSIEEARDDHYLIKATKSSTGM